MKKVSIIIINYNGIKFIKNCLDSLQKIDYPDFEIIVLDNGSTDGSVELLKEYKATHLNTYVMFYQLNVGLGWGSNLATTYADGEYLFFLNNDTLVDKDILTKLVNYYPEFKGVLGCRMGDYNGTQQLDSFISVDRFCYPCGTTSNMFYPDGAIFISKSIFKEIGGFDEKLFLYGEDRDLCWRVWLAGYFCLPCATAIFYHASSSVVGTNYKRRYIAERNLIRSMLKNYGSASLCRIIPQYIALSIFEIMFLMLTGNILAIHRCYLRAYWWNLVNIDNTWRYRKVVQKNRKVSDKMIRKRMSRQIGKLFVLTHLGLPKFKEIAK